MVGVRLRFARGSRELVPIGRDRAAKLGEAGHRREDWRAEPAQGSGGDGAVHGSPFPRKSPRNGDRSAVHTGYPTNEGIRCIPGTLTRGRVSPMNGSGTLGISRSGGGCRTTGPRSLLYHSGTADGHRLTRGRRPFRKEDFMFVRSMTTALATVFLSVTTRAAGVSGAKASAPSFLFSPRLAWRGGARADLVAPRACRDLPLRLDLGENEGALGIDRRHQAWPPGLQHRPVLEPLLERIDRG